MKAPTTSSSARPIDVISTRLFRSALRTRLFFSLFYSSCHFPPSHPSLLEMDGDVWRWMGRRKVAARKTGKMADLIRKADRKRRSEIGSTVTCGRELVVGTFHARTFSLARAPYGIGHNSSTVRTTALRYHSSDCDVLGASQETRRASDALFSPAGGTLWFGVERGPEPIRIKECAGLGAWVRGDVRGRSGGRVGMGLVGVGQSVLVSLPISAAVF